MFIFFYELIPEIFSFSRKVLISSFPDMMVIGKIKKDYNKIIKTLEDELVRKQKQIDDLKETNIVLLKTALKKK